MMVSSRPAAQPRSYENTSGRPSWSPDGRRIAAELGRKTVIVDRDSLQVESQLAPEASWVATPDWSPDGQKIAYAAYTTPEGQELPRWGVYVSDPDGANARELSEDAWEPEWNAQGTRLVFQTHKKGQDHVAVIDPEGKNEVWLSPDGILQSDFCWDPKGEQVVYDHWGDEGPQIRISDFTGKKDRMLTNGEGFYKDRNPEWSPDGKKVLFERHDPRFPKVDLWTVDPLTGKDKLLVELPRRNVDAVWSPDGGRIAFASNKDGGDFDLFVMDANGKNVERVSHLRGDEHAPAWSPDGHSLAFYCLDWNKEGDDRYTLQVIDV
ncbi:MAG: PD40 domain-containing protein [Candidatus Eremiobacteraeota bacterium]|nr:PD40 domain-containing protein [Candidatus Eremiobacteraeota bacterium]